jgi:hypothetical protein
MKRIGRGYEIVKSVPRKIVLDKKKHSFGRSIELKHATCNRGTSQMLVLEKQASP